MYLIIFYIGTIRDVRQLIAVRKYEIAHIVKPKTNITGRKEHLNIIYLKYDDNNI